MSDDRQPFTPLTSFKVTEGDHDAGLRLVGELDVLTVSDLNEALAGQNGRREVTLDLSGLTFIDSSGIHAIVTFARSREPDGAVILSGVPPFLLRLFEITRLAQVPGLRIRG